MLDIQIILKSKEIEWLLLNPMKIERLIKIVLHLKINPIRKPSEKTDTEMKLFPEQFAELKK